MSLRTGIGVQLKDIKVFNRARQQGKFLEYLKCVLMILCSSVFKFGKLKKIVVDFTSVQEQTCARTTTVGASSFVFSVVMDSGRVPVPTAC